MTSVGLFVVYKCGQPCSTWKGPGSTLPLLTSSFQVYRLQIKGPFAGTDPVHPTEQRASVPHWCSIPCSHSASALSFPVEKWHISSSCCLRTIAIYFHCASVLLQDTPKDAGRGECEEVGERYCGVRVGVVVWAWCGSVRVGVRGWWCESGCSDVRVAVRVGVVVWVCDGVRACVVVWVEVCDVVVWCEMGRHRVQWCEWK